MTGTAPKSKRGRTLWLVISLLFLVSVSYWCLTPSIDQRFVGNWHVTEEFNGSVMERGETLRLFRDGTGERVFENIGVAPMRWRFSGNVLNYLPESRIGELRIWLEDRIHQIRTGAPRLRSPNLVAIEIMPDQITLRSSSNGYSATVKLNRLAE